MEFVLEFVRWNIPFPHSFPLLSPHITQHPSSHHTQSHTLVLSLPQQADQLHNSCKPIIVTHLTTEYNAIIVHSDSVSLQNRTDTFT